MRTYEDRYPCVDLATGRRGTYVITERGTRYEWEPEKPEPRWMAWTKANNNVKETK